MDGRDLEPAVDCSRGDGDVIRQPTVCIGVDRSVRDWWCSGAVWVEMCRWCGCCHGASSDSWVLGHPLFNQPLARLSCLLVRNRFVPEYDERAFRQDIRRHTPDWLNIGKAKAIRSNVEQIGRASCRER